MKKSKPIKKIINKWRGSDGWVHDAAVQKINKPKTFLYTLSLFSRLRSAGRGINVPGLVGIIIFYIIILGIGLWAAWRRRGEANTEEVMLAGRDIGLFIGVLTMTGK